MKVLKVIKIGGKIVESEHELATFVKRFADIEGPKILIHGGGVIATRIGMKLGIEAKLKEGRRITDRKSLDVMTMVYGGLINKQLVAKLQAAGCNAVGLSGADLNIIKARKRAPHPVDYGWVGDIEEVNDVVLEELLKKGITPVLAPLTHDGKGHLLNTNADAIASFVAGAMSARWSSRLVLCFNQPGVMNKGKVISELNFLLYRHLRETGIVTDGMIPKLDLGFQAIRSGVQSVRITAFHSVHEESKGTVLIK